MAYTPTTWAEGVTKLGPTNMNHLELGVQATAVVADAAIPKPSNVANGALVWNGAAWVSALLVNANVDPAAAIAYSKLNLAGLVVNNDIGAAAAIAYSKLNLAASVVNADIASGAAIANSKLAVPSGISVICDTTLGGSQATIDTNTILGGNIPQTYSHLKVVIVSREDTVTTLDTILMRINNDSTANYDWQYSRAAGASASAGEGLGQTSVTVGLQTGASVTAGVFSATEILIPHYTGTTANKTMTCATTGKTGTATGNIFFQSSAGFWRSSAAITRLTFLPASGNFIAGTRITVYGMV